MPGTASPTVSLTPSQQSTPRPGIAKRARD
jgi:ATP-dependent DNA helicase PIF1